jgi:hypothetical protein
MAENKLPDTKTRAFFIMTQTVPLRKTKIKELVITFHPVIITAVLYIFQKRKTENGKTNQNYALS